MEKLKLGIQAKLLAVLLPVIFVVLGLILLLVYADTSKMMLQRSEELLATSTESVNNTVTAWMNKTIMALVTERDAIEYFDMDATKELDYIKHTANQYESFPAGIYLATTDGKLIHASFVPGPEYNVFEKSWYKDGLQSEDFIFGSVYFDEDSQSYVVGASGVLKKKDGSVRGVAAADIYLDAISEIVKQVKLEETGGAFLVDSLTNTIIGHADQTLVGVQLGEQTDGIYPFVNEFVAAGKTGVMTCNSPSGEVYLDIQEVPGSHWLTVSYVPRAEVLRDLNRLTQTIVVLAVAALLLLTILILLSVRRSIVKPIRKIDHVARRIADGELNQKINYTSNDELGALAGNFNKTAVRLSGYVAYIQEISKVLNDIAAGNLDFQVTLDYTGEFAKVRDALSNISASLNDTLGQINISASQVSSGSEQVSSGAQALSQGATEQASSIQQLAATISEISGQVKRNAENAVQASQRAQDVGNGMEQSNQKMQDMIQAMSRISNSSSEIGKIIKTIEDIAFQTNILALNAAVEAARAGAAGKGFAVVADEVRNLASKSSEASKNTTALIENSLHAVAQGTSIADDTAKALLQSMEGAKEVVKTVNLISDASQEQANSIEQMTLGVDQISSVVQTNSATAEESAAASEELSGQAMMLKEQVGRFHLKENQKN